MAKWQENPVLEGHGPSTPLAWPRPPSSRSSPAPAAKAVQSTTVVAQSQQASGIAAIVRKAMTTYHLRAVIVRVTKGSQVVTTQAFGPSLTGQPATPAMHFRNGAVAFAYVATLLMEYVDEHKVSLNDTVNRWDPRCRRPT